MRTKRAKIGRERTTPSSRLTADDGGRGLSYDVDLWAPARRPFPLAKLPDKAVRQQLSRILASKTFSQVDRLKRFVSFIVGETVAGRGGDLKEYVIGVQVFGKEPSFDPRTDPIVRVQARRLRTRLARYYRDEGNSDELDHRSAEGRLRAGLPARATKRRSPSAR